MNYLFTFLEGIASFISPCILPVIPIYISYFIGTSENKNTSKTIINAIGFVLGFTISFVILSVFASVLGGLISSNIKYIKILLGMIVIILGLNYMDIFSIKALNKTKGITRISKNTNLLKTLLFGMLFAITWTPCVGTFLSSALFLIAKEQDVLKGIILILVYSAGIGVPFIISAIFIDKLKSTFDFIKKHYDVIKKISGIILILMGLYIIFF